MIPGRVYFMGTLESCAAKEKYNMSHMCNVKISSSYVKK